MALALDVQDAGAGAGFPAPREMRRVLRAALGRAARLTVRLVGADEGADLNARYRRKRGPTNVLAFDYGDSGDGPIDGDIVLCAPVVRAEAERQGRPVGDHCAHLLVHAALHLQGHSHGREREAEAMRRREEEILGALGFPPPGKGGA